MDAKTEMTLALQDKISKLQERVVDFQEQVEAAQSGLDTILREKAWYEYNGQTDEWVNQYSELQKALYENNTNVNSDNRMIDMLKKKLANGECDMPSTSKFSATKRKLDSGVSDVFSECSASKRKFTD